jgi:hypothetical protein
MLAKAKGKVDFDRRYAALESWVFNITPNAVGNVVFKMSAPKTVYLRDPVLGFLEKAGWIGLCVMLGMVLIDQKGYLVAELPDASPNIFFERGTFNYYRNYHPFGTGTTPFTPDIGAQPSAAGWGPGKEVAYCQQSTGRDGTKYAWNDASSSKTAKVVCRQLNFAEFTKKGSREAYLMTYQNEVYSTVFNCSSFGGTFGTTRTEGAPWNQDSDEPATLGCRTPMVRQAPETLSTILQKEYPSPEFWQSDAARFGLDYWEAQEDDTTSSCACLEARNFAASTYLIHRKYVTCQRTTNSVNPSCTRIRGHPVFAPVSSWHSTGWASWKQRRPGGRNREDAAP